MSEDASGPDDDPRDQSSTGSDDRWTDGSRGGADGGWSIDTTRSDGPDRDEEYRVPIDLSSDADGTDVADDGEDEDDFGPEPSSAPVEPGEPKIEHAIFVLLGAVAMLLVVFRILSLPL